MQQTHYVLRAPGSLFWVMQRPLLLPSCPGESGHIEDHATWNRLQESSGACLEATHPPQFCCATGGEAIWGILLYFKVVPWYQWICGIWEGEGVWNKTLWIWEDAFILRLST